MSLLLQNKLLAAAEAKVESNLTPQNRADYMKIVVAGLKVALQKGPNGILASIKQSKNPIADCANGAINLCLLMARQSRGTMPAKAMVPAAMTLMLNALDFAEKAGVLQVGQKELVEATHIFTNAVFQRFGITAPMLHTAMQRVHQITQDPGKMEQLKRVAGLSKGPVARPPAPTPAPAAAAPAAAPAPGQAPNG